MRRSSAMLIAAGFFLILGLETLFTVLLSTPDGMRMKSPEGSATLGRSFTASGDAWMREGTASVRVSAVNGDPGGTLLNFAATRDTVNDRGRPLFALSTWSARITLPSDGQWELRATVFGRSGGWSASSVKTVNVRAGTAVREFNSWTPEHLVPVAIIVAGALTLGFVVRHLVRRGTIEAASSPFRRAALLLTGLMWLNEVCYQTYWFFIGGWSAASSLMLQMCGLSILFLPVAMLSENPKRRQRLFDVLYFWGIGGAAQALIAPDIGSNGFPAFRYFSFFISHGLIITCSTVMALGGGVRITLKSLLRALIVTNVLLVPLYGIDRLITLIPPYDPGNYFILGFPPPTGSVVDVFAGIFGPSPRYVVGLEIMGIVVFALLYVPWPIARWIRTRTHPRRAEGIAT